MPQNILLCDYFENWISIYKEGAVRDVTLRKYKMSLKRLSEIVPNLMLPDLDRIQYQKIINEYAKTHERQTTMDFHHHIKSAILDALDDGLLERDPTRKTVIKGKSPSEKKVKYLSQYDLHKLLESLELSNTPSWEWLILFIAKTGLRFSEAIAITPEDVDFRRQHIVVNKTWDYKNGGGFVPTKNKSSERKVTIDWQLTAQLAELAKQMEEQHPIFVFVPKVYNSTPNAVLERYCKSLDIPVISLHGLRHTHASILLYAGVSVASVSKRLGHSTINTTQKVYLHIIRELENQDNDLVMRAVSGLC